MRHHPGGSPHEFAYRTWQSCRARVFCLPTVADLVVAHRLDDGATSLVVGRQPFEMALEMAFHLPLSFGHEAEARLVAEQCRERADAERAGIPEWIENAGSRAEFAQPRLAPGEVVGLFAGGVEHEFADFRIPGEQRLRVVQRLRGDF